MNTSQDLTTAEAAARLQVSERTIRRMIARGTLAAYKLDPEAKSVYRIPIAEVERLLRERNAPADARE